MLRERKDGGTRVASAGALRAARMACIGATIAAGTLMSQVGVGTAAAPSRGYELVSPPDTRGQSVFPLVTVPAKDGGNLSAALTPQAAADGHAVFLQGTAPLPGYDTTAQNPYYVAERTSVGWSTTSLTPPRLSSSLVLDIQSFDSSFGNVIFRNRPIPGAPLLDPEDVDSSSELYGGDRDQIRSFRLTWLSRALPERPGIRIQQGLTTPDSRHVVFSGLSNESLNSSAPDSFGALYINTPGAREPEIVSVLPSGDVVGSPGGAPPRAQAISDDGDRVAFESAGTLYVRLRAERRTVAVGPGLDGEGAPARFSSDGSSVEFPSLDSLAAADTDASSDIYRVAIDSGGPPELLTPGTSSDCANSYGEERCDASPVATSPDGRVTYFLSPEVLSGGSGGRSPVEGEPNLYLNAGGGARFVATLAPDDASSAAPPSSPQDNDPPVGSLRANLPSLRHARVSADGGALVFQSRAAIDPAATSGTPQLYRFDAGSGRLDCVSCGDSALDSPRPARWKSFDQSQSIEVPNAPAASGRGVTSDGSRVFFQTAQRLVRSDLNGQTDVYEYDAADRSVSLVSTGRSASPSYYVDNSLDGRDVFIQTRDVLAADDRNGASYKIYDARAGGGFPGPVAPSAGCVGEACRGVAPVLPSGASSGTGGASTDGNARPSPRLRLRLRRPTRAELRRLTRTGSLSVRVATSGRARVSGTLAFGRSDSKAGVSARRAGTVVLRFRLTRSARRLLAARGGRLTIVAKAAGARTQRLTATVGRS